MDSEPAPRTTTVHIAKRVYVAMPTSGDEATLPHVLTPSEEKWMKATLQDEIGNDVTKLFKGAYVEVPGYVVWMEDFGYDVRRDPVIEKREAAARAQRKARRTEWAEAV